MFVSECVVCLALTRCCCSRDCGQWFGFVGLLNHDNGEGEEEEKGGGGKNENGHIELDSR